MAWLLPGLSDCLAAFLPAGGAGGGGRQPPLRVGGRTLRHLAPLDEGAFSLVELRVDEASGERVALKRVVIRPDEDGGSNGRLEAELLRELAPHAHIVRLLAAAELEPSPARPHPELLLATQLCAGGRLVEALAARRGVPLGEGAALRAFRGVASAVAHMHARSPPILHLDLKAENVLLSGPPTPARAGGARGGGGAAAGGAAAPPPAELPPLVLCDFGSAVRGPIRLADRPARELAAEQERLDATTTLAYRAPELADVRSAAAAGARALGPAVDVWALGVLLYRLLFLKMPFEDSLLAVLDARWALPPDRPPPSAPTLAILQSALARDAARRPTAAALLHAVDEALAGLPPR